MSRRLKEEAVSSAIGVLFMILITVFLSVIIAAFVLNAVYPEKPVYTAFDVKELSSSSLKITSISGSSVELDNTNVTINGVSYPVTWADSSGDDMWNPGETLILTGVNLNNYTTINIISGRYLLFTCDFPAQGTTPVPTSTPSPTPTPTPTPAPLPAANFTVDTSTSLKAVFTDTSSNAVSWHWEFGDGATGAVASPTRIYVTGGTYVVTLTVYNIDGVSNSTTRSIVVTPGAPTPVPTPTPTPIPTPTPTPTPVPTPTPTPVPGPFAPGIMEQYYNDITWSMPLASHPVAEIQFANAFAQTNPPYYFSDIPNWPLIGRDTNFSVRYEGYIKITSDDTYTFYLTVDDDGALYIDNAFVIGMGGVPGIEKSGSMTLAAGYHSIRVVAYQTDGQAIARLQYESPLQTKRFVTELYH